MYGYKLRATVRMKRAHPEKGITAEITLLFVIIDETKLDIKLIHVLSQQRIVLVGRASNYVFF